MIFLATCVRSFALTARCSISSRSLCLWFFRCSFAREKRPNIRFGHEAGKVRAGSSNKMKKPSRQFNLLQLRHKKMAVSSTCNDGWHAYKAWFIPLELGMVVRNGCTSHNSLSSLSAQAASSAFFNAASPRAAAMALAKRRAVANENHVMRSIVGRKCLLTERWASIGAFAGCKFRGCKFRVVCHSSTLHSDSPGTMLQAALHRSCCRVLLRSVAPLVTTGVRTFPQTQTIAGSTERCSVASLP